MTQGANKKNRECFVLDISCRWDNVSLFARIENRGFKEG